LGTARRLLTTSFALLAILGASHIALGDVTGSFSTNFVLTPQSTASEISLIDFDIVNELNLTVSISGLSNTLHSHFGIAGVEDAILTLNGVMGFMSFDAQLVFARFASGSIDPFYDELRFIAKTLTAEMGFGGVSFTNIAQFEDTNAFVSQSSAYAFGDALFVAGQTLSGISVEAGVGICLQDDPLAIKHHVLSGFSVNPDCATEPKPDILFDFESIVIQNVPLAPGITSDTSIFCETISACQLISQLSIAGGPVPFTATLFFTDLLAIDFGFAQISLTSGPATLALIIGQNGTLGLATLDLETTLNPESNPATLEIATTVVPGVGLTDAVVGINISRAGLDFGATALFTGGATLDFGEIQFELATTLPRAMGNLGMEAAFEPTGGLSRAEIVLTIVI